MARSPEDSVFHGGTGGMPGLTHLLLVEEYVIVRSSIRAFLERELDLEVCGEASSLSEAISGDWEPDVVVHGLLLPDCFGPTVVAKLRERFPKSGLLVLSRLDMPIYVHLAVTSGADGYVLKSADTVELLRAIRHVAAGQGYVQPALGLALARWEDIPCRRTEDTPVTALTRREQELLELIALGHTNVEIAEAMSVGVRTVESHRSHITQKLGLSSRSDLVRYFLDRQRHTLPDAESHPSR